MWRFSKTVENSWNSGGMVTGASKSAGVVDWILMSAGSGLKNAEMMKAPLNSCALRAEANVGASRRLISKGGSMEGFEDLRDSGVDEDEGEGGDLKGSGLDEGEVESEGESEDEGEDEDESEDEDRSGEECGEIRGDAS